ncbi:MAG: nucleoside triphosphate pyrophosphohydrolase [Proteobacteria bacterium]|nr:nucleoside triphosphate pyrophosphohydrolase [Pseudomonadota bacterium]MBI3495967.1 nucleoside triphosphate pyrophosphohydrolase [Pseudomonadota bacterium]
MTEEILFSEDGPPFDWSDAASYKVSFGPKGALLATLPRLWTPPFVLVPASVLTHSENWKHLALGKAFIARARLMAASSGLIVRSSVLGESIWDRGRYQSVIVNAIGKAFKAKLHDAAAEVLASASGKPTALVIQRYVKAQSRGEFGNLFRISKTRDQWELSTENSDGTTFRTRFNTQRDEAAWASTELQIRTGLSRERLFGSIGAWLNNVLLRGRQRRINCEWIAESKRVHLVQIDEEDEDAWGINPFQIPIAAAHSPSATRGAFLARAEGQSLQHWDKLKVLDELWEPEASHKPVLFFVALSDLVSAGQGVAKRLEHDFATLIGPDNIVVRTSVRAGDKPPNLPRTECLQPKAAAAWCLGTLKAFECAGSDLDGLAFVAHRFIAARASAWVRADPQSPIVEVHSLWGLPDALQYCPYDIWEIHVRTELATDYPEYKSNILVPGADGVWKYERVKNELARALSIGRREAVELATRTAAIAERIGGACHVMWFVGCVDRHGTRFNIPWYWTKAHDIERNVDRANYQLLTISDWNNLTAFKNFRGSRWRQAVELRPNLNLLRDMGFIEAVGRAAGEHGVPVILAGSTLAHAYYQLRRTGCAVVTRGEKEHSRVRQSTIFGKLIRDKIPGRIAQRREAEITRAVPNEFLKGYLTGKLIEEAMEVRGADGRVEKTLELADLYEVVRAWANLEGVSIDEVVEAANRKRAKAGGFEKGIVLLQTGILGRDRAAIPESDRPIAHVLARRISGSSYEIPFSFFGFMELDQPRLLTFEDSGVRLSIKLKSDRIEVQLLEQSEQLELPIDLASGQDSSAKLYSETVPLKKQPKRSA